MLVILRKLLHLLKTLGLINPKSKCESEIDIKQSNRFKPKIDRVGKIKK